MTLRIKSGLFCLTVVVAVGCKSGTDAAGPVGSSSGLASITIGDVKSVTHKDQELTATVNGTKKSPVRGSAAINQMKFSAGDEVVLSMKLYTDKDQVAALSVDEANSKCKPLKMKLAAGANKANIPLCIAPAPGTPITDPSKATVTQTTGENADINIAPCIVGVDPGCGEDGKTNTAANTTPTFNKTPITFDYVLFAIDISGSMTGKKWDGAKAELIKAATELKNKSGTTTVINVIAFNDTVKMFLTGEINSVDAEFENLKTWLNGLTPSGQTAMKAGLTETFNYYSGTFKAVYLITDGAPTDMGTTAADLAALEAANSNKLPIHVQAIGPTANYETFLKSLAAKNGGSYSVFTP